MAEGVEPDHRAIRNKHPFGARRIDGIFPSWLDGAFVSPRHDGVEVMRLRPLQFKRRENGPFAAEECPKRGIDGAYAQGFFGCNREGFARTEGRVAKERDEHRLNEFTPDGGFLGFAKVRMADLFGPILRGLALLFGRVE